MDGQGAPGEPIGDLDAAVRAVRQGARILVVSNEKGGVGKTSLSTNIAASMAADFGLHVLYLDFDPQCNATRTMMGVTPQDYQNAGGMTISSVLRGEVTLQGAMHTTPHHERLFAIAGDRDIELSMRALMDALAAEMAPQALPEETPEAAMNRLLGEFFRRIRRGVRMSLPPTIDVVVMDTPPNRGTLPLQVAVAIADRILLVARPDRDSAHGVSAITTVAKAIGFGLGETVPICGVIMNMAKATRPREVEVIRQYRQHFKDVLLEQVIPDHDTVSAHGDRGGLVVMEGYRTPAAVLIRTASGVLLQRLGATPKELPMDIIGRLPAFEGVAV